MKRGFFKFGRLALPIIVSAVVSFGRIMPTTVDQANAEFDARRANVVKGWVYKYQHDALEHTTDWPQGFKPWCEGDVRNSLREVWAGLFVFANPQYFTQSEFSALSGLPGASFNDQLVEYRNKVYHYLETVEEFETIGTDLGSGYLFLQNDSDARKYWGYNESKVKHGGDYDFVLQNLIQLVYAFIDRPDIMTNDMIWEIISQNNTSKRRLHISSLKCHDTEGWVTDDHFRLYVKQIPSGDRVSIERDMGDGDLWDINTDFDFLGDKLQLDGWDIDAVDSDDHLGSNTIDRSLKTDASCLFNWDDADYQLKYSVFIPTPDRHIVIESLHCSETEDFLGADESMLKVMPDGTAKPALTKSMNNGDDWTINSAFAFSDNVRIQLWDQDNDNWTTLWQDDDDLLGDVTIGKDLVEHATKSFDLDGAHYTMTYSVREGIEGTDMTVGGVQIINDQAYGKVPVTGQDINDFVNVCFHGKQFIKFGANFQLDYKDSQAETENHMLGIYCWRYLVQNYLEWVASLPATDPRYDVRLKKVFDSDPQRYRNGTDVTNFVQQMVSRPVYNDLFETNAKMYEAVSINALQTFYSYADKLHSLKQINPSYGGDKIKAAAQNSLDYLSAKFAFQSFEGKRLPPQRRNWDAYRFNYDSHGGNYVSDIFGVLSGEYTYDDSYQAAPQTLPKQTVVKLQKVICSNAEDNIGKDDVRVKINCDGKNMTPLLKRMDTGDDWTINQEFAFNDIAKIKIVEEDNDPDDNIGTVTIGTDPVTDVTVNLHTFWADYKVVYSVYQKDTTYRPYSADQIDQHGGYALFSALMDYRLDPAVHDFMLNKHTGYYARIQSRYTDKSYDLDYDWGIATTPSNRGFVKPQYFNADGTIFSTGNFKPITQIYFATPDYLSTAGGKFDRYYNEHKSMVVTDLWIDPMKGYHEIMHPYTLITRDNVNLVNPEEVNELESKMLVMRGINSYDKRYSDNAEPDSRDENNLWTYKSFSYAENYLDQWPQRYPAWWDEWSLPTFTTGGAEYKILDFSNASASSISLNGYYLILARLTSTNGYNRGFWEIVPKRLYTDAAALQTAIRSSNGQAFTGNTYTYRMMTTGEQIVINKTAGQSQSITAIKDINGNSLPLNDYFLDNSSDESLKNLPLISVRGVDSHYNFNGSEYCYSKGDGYVEINNPFIGRYLRLDSRNYKNPSRTIDMPLLTFEDPRFTWTATGATLQPDKDNKTEGTQSLKVVGTGYMTVMTPRFDTRDLKKVSNQIGIDVYVPSPLTNPYWPGYVELFIDMPSAGIYNQMIGHYDFTSSQAGTWVPVTFTLSDKIVSALSADNPDMQFRIILNTNQNNPYFELDNMRFLRAATEVAQAPVVPISDASGSFGSFDNISIWHCSNATLQQVSSPSSDGGTAMQVNGKGYMVITCNNLKSADLAGKGNTMAFDLYIPKAMAGKGWYGSATLSLTIPSLGIYSAQCNQIDLTNTRTGEFNSLKFQVPGDAAAKLSSKPFTDGQLSIILNTPSDAPAYVVDRLGFVN